MSRIEKGATKKVAKSIKIDYILNVAVQDYAKKNGLYEIDVLEMAIKEFFTAKEENKKFDYLISLAEISNSQQEILIKNSEKIIDMAK